MTDSINLTDYTEDVKPIPVIVNFDFNRDEDYYNMISVKYGYSTFKSYNDFERLHPECACEIDSLLENYSEQNRIKGEITHRFPN
jgi:hypothetical protein